MKKVVFAGFFITISLLLQTITLADGGIFIDYYKYVYLPSQKAAIFWDGFEEKMVLSTKIKTDDLTNMAWVIPIQSRTKPDVEKGDMDIFYDLAWLLTPRYYYGRDIKTTGGAAGGVQVIEIKKIDIYDIAILTATDASILVDWLNENGYIVPETTIPILQDYCDREEFYFIANKINLMNKFSSIFINRDSSKVIDACGKEETNYFLNLNKNDFIKRILCGLSYPTYSDQWWKTAIDELESADIISSEKYYEWSNDYRVNNEICEKILTKKAHYVSTLADAIMEGKDIYDGRNLIYNGDSNKRYYLSSYALEDLDITKEGVIDLLNKYGSNVRNNYLGVLESSDLLECEELGQEVRNIQEGISTPLEITFRPDKPFYPLKISSINEGNTEINVYVLSRTPVKDENGVLSIYQMTGLSTYLKDNYNLSVENYVTLLTYNDSLKGLDSDSFFVSTEYDENLDPNPKQTITTTTVKAWPCEIALHSKSCDFRPDKKKWLASFNFSWLGGNYLRLRINEIGESFSDQFHETSIHYEKELKSSGYRTAQFVVYQPAGNYLCEDIHGFYCPTTTSTVSTTIPKPRCGDDICEKDENCENCVPDCKCPVNYNCEPSSNLADKNGCVKTEIKNKCVFECSKTTPEFLCRIGCAIVCGLGLCK